MLFSTKKGKNAVDADSVDLSSDPQTAASTTGAAGWQDLTISAGQSVQNSAAQAYAGNTPPANAQVDQLNYSSSMQQSEPGMSAPASPVGPPDIWEETGVVQRPAAPVAQVQQPADAQTPYAMNAAVPATSPAMQQMVPPAPPQYAPAVSMPVPPAAPIQGYDLASAQPLSRADDQTLSASQAPLQRVDSVPNFSVQSTNAPAALASQSLVGILAQELGEVPPTDIQQAAPVVPAPEPMTASAPVTPAESESVQIPVGEHDLDLSDSHTKARVVQAALQDVDAAIVKFGVDKAQIDEWTAIVRERMYTLFEVHEDDHAHVVELQRKIDSLHMILGTRDEELALLKQKIGEQ